MICVYCKSNMYKNENNWHCPKSGRRVYFNEKYSQFRNKSYKKYK